MLLFKVVKNQNIARHVRGVGGLVVDEVWEEEELPGAHPRTLQEPGRLLLHSVDQVVDQPGEDLLLVPQQLVGRVVYVRPGHLDDPL